MFVGAAIGVLFSSIACGGSDDTELNDTATCIPNQTRVCECPNGDSGAQECRADRSGFGPCTGCAPADSNGCQAPNCGTCSSCYDACTCKGGDPKKCVAECSSSGGSNSGGGGSPGGGGISNTGGSTSSGGSPATGGTSAGGTSCEACVAASCPSQLQSCASTSGCLDLVLCAQGSGCMLSDYGCLLGACGTYLFNFGAVGPAMSLGNCAASQCAAECA